MQDQVRRAARWFGPALVLAGMLVLIGVWVERANNPGMIAYGVMHTITSYERVLPLLAIGLAFAQMPWRYASSGLFLLILSAAVGWTTKDLILSALLTRPEAVKYLAYLRFIGPISCVLAGLLLGAPGVSRLFLMPVISILFGAMLGFGLALEDPTLGQWLYIAGIAATLLWLVLVPSLGTDSTAVMHSVLPTRVDQGGQP
jgi:hypothetical protein